jgi:hypothetical protein
MPCSDPFPYDLPEPPPREHTQQKLKSNSSYQRAKNLGLYGVETTDEELPGRLMEIACQAFQELDNALSVLMFPGFVYECKFPENHEWWINHQARDAKRLERVLENALAKLSAEEQEVLKAFFGEQK